MFIYNDILGVAMIYCFYIFFYCYNLKHKNPERSVVLVQYMIQVDNELRMLNISTKSYFYVTSPL